MAVQVDVAASPFSPLIGLAPLMRHVFEGQDLQPIATALLKRAEEHPDDANALMDGSTVLQLTGHKDLALALQSQAIAIQHFYSFAPQTEARLKLLVIMGPGDLMANTPIEFLVEDSDVELTLLYLSLDTAWPDVVPEHDVMCVAIAESKANQELLRRVSLMTADWPRPVLNLPERIAVLSRDGVCRALQDCPGVEMPLTTRIRRNMVEQLADGDIDVQSLLPDARFPLIIRPLGSHAGTHLEKIDAPADLKSYLQKLDAEEFYISRFVDYSSPDGRFRKYRIAVIAGQPYVCHYAISSHWMIHYLNAGMGESAEKRAEEAACMANFEQEFGLRQQAAIAAIDQRMGLPYLGIDCAETQDGKLLIFEVDNAMIVHALDPVDMYPYKKPAMQKVFSAFRKLLEDMRYRT